jgi:hypothetical protein
MPPIVFELWKSSGYSIIHLSCYCGRCFCYWKFPAPNRQMSPTPNTIPSPKLATVQDDDENASGGVWPGVATVCPWRVPLCEAVPLQASPHLPQAPRIWLHLCRVCIHHPFFFFCFDLPLLADQQNAWMQNVEADKLLLLRLSSGAPRVPGPVERSLGLHLPSLSTAGALFTAQPRGQCPCQVSPRALFISIGSSQVPGIFLYPLSRSIQIKLIYSYS